MFPLFQTPIDLAHDYWKRVLQPNDLAIDATCGNGHDALFIAKLIPNGILIAIDRQTQAIQATQERLSNAFVKNLILYEQCHSTFPQNIAPQSIALIVYNLGYLPKSDKTVITLPSTTVQSLQNAKKLLKPGGLLSIMCYPGHEGGKEEEEAVLEFSRTLDQTKWSCCHHRWTNRRQGPSFLIIQKILA